MDRIQTGRRWIIERDFEVSSGFSGPGRATVNWMKLSHLGEAPPMPGGNVCMRGRRRLPTPPPSYLQFTPDKACPGNSPVVHARKTHMCPPGPARHSQESNRAKSQRPACIFICLVPTHFQCLFSLYRCGGCTIGAQKVPGAVLRRSEMWWRCNHVIKSRKKLYSQSKTTKIKFHLNN